ncbi:MAG: GNAT family N-acetyltransferase, partial [Rubrivivax sp.]
VFDAAIRRAGMLRVDTLQELFIAAETLSHLRESLALRTGDEAELADAERLTILTNGGGAGVMAADAAAAAGLALATLPEDVTKALDGVLPSLWSHANPVDMIGDAPPQRYIDALRILQDSPQTGQLLLIHAPTAIVPSADIAAALAPLAGASAGRLTTCWLGGPAVQAARERFGQAGIPCHDTPEDAVRALALVATYRRNQAMLMEAPPDRGDDPFDVQAIRAVVHGALKAGRRMLTEPEAKALLSAAGVPVVPTLVVKASPIAAQRAAEGIGYPVVLKILSPDLSHKSDVGGVALALGDGPAVNAAARAMLRRIRQLRPDARLEGFTVQAMVRRPQALELIAGTHLDELFGPVVLFGAGGTAVEVLQDRALALPPLNAPLARQLMARTRVARLLRGWRDVPAADTPAIERVLVALSRLMAEVPEIAGIDINPLLADAQGVIALDARVQVDPAAPGGAARFAIRPYPTELVQRLTWQDRPVTIRPIRPEDEQRHRQFLERITPADIRMRVFYSRRSIERSELARLTQIDYEREMALVATAPGPDGAEETLGTVRAVTDPDNHDAEFGILVRSDLKGKGLGRLLMNAMIDHLKRRGTKRLVATVLHENSEMLALGRALGFAPDAKLADGDGLAGIALDLQPAAGTASAR